MPKSRTRQTSVPAKHSPHSRSAGVVVYDANVLFSKPVRFLLLHMASEGLVQAKFSDHQLFESAGAVASRQRFDSLVDLGRLLSSLGDVIRDNTVGGYKKWLPLIKDMSDEGDRRVLATAIQGGATTIVTKNTRDFPRDELARWGVRAETPDTFLLRCVHLDPVLVVAICDRHGAGARRFVEQLRAEAPKTSAALRAYVNDRS